MNKRIKTAVRATRTPVAGITPRNVFLAGLGAVSLAQKQGEKTLGMLVEEGEAFKGRTEKFATTLVKDVRRTAAGVERQVKAMVTPLRQRAVRTARQVESAIGRMQLPTPAEVQKLIKGFVPGKVSVRVTRTGRRRRAA